MSFAAPSRLPSVSEVIVKREFWRFFREPAQWLHLVVFMLLMLIFLLSIRGARIQTELAYLQAVVYTGLFLFNGFLLASVILRFIFPMVSLEGETIWVIRSAPVQPLRIAGIRFLWMAVPVLLLALILGYGGHFPWRHDRRLFMLAVTGEYGLAVLFTGILTGLGSVYRTYREKSPVRIASSQGATAAFFVELLILAVVTAMLFIPVYRMAYVGGRLHDGPDQSAIAILTVVLGAGGAVAVWGLRKAAEAFGPDP